MAGLIGFSLNYQTPQMDLQHSPEIVFLSNFAS